MQKNGFTLIETMFSIMFVGCAAAIVVAAMPASTASKTKAKYTNFAVNFAAKEIEDIQYLDFSKVNASDMESAGIIDSAKPVSGKDTYSCNAVVFGAGDTIGQKLPNGTATVRVEELTLDTKRVTIHVQWKERSNLRTYDIGTVVARL